MTGLVQVRANRPRAAAPKGGCWPRAPGTGDYGRARARLLAPLCACSRSAPGCPSANQDATPAPVRPTFLEPRSAPRSDAYRRFLQLLVVQPPSSGPSQPCHGGRRVGCRGQNPALPPPNDENACSALVSACPPPHTPRQAPLVAWGPSLPRRTPPPWWMRRTILPGVARSPHSSAPSKAPTGTPGTILRLLPLILPGFARSPQASAQP
mmetsp:Transcript_1477/g.2983  ORF Transcript_1477/g.2983 Transcript_1477/m.2983 type:complete len:209 (-) Transcript_1477:439-1065(-)